jgi:putative effector of murein hydrolase LrgA (UPF0299 family)
MMPHKSPLHPSDLGKSLTHMKAILKCIHPLLPASIGVFAFLLFALPIRIEDVFSVGQGGPCSGLPVFLLFVPRSIFLRIRFGLFSHSLFRNAFHANPTER